MMDEPLLDYDTTNDEPFLVIDARYISMTVFVVVLFVIRKCVVNEEGM